MNRRQFSQRLAALFAAPALPPNAIVAAATSATAPAALPSGAIFWAKYLSSLHQSCTPDMLGTMLNVSDKAARHMHRELVTKGVITKSGMVHKTLTEPTKRRIENVEMPEKSKNPSVRMAVEQDMPAIANIWHDGWHEAHAAHVPADFTVLRTIESFVARLEANLLTTQVVGPVGAPVGFSMIRGDELYQIYVDPAARGRGVSDALLKAGENMLAQNGVGSAVLHALPENDRAIAFYQRNGWAGDQVIDVALETLAEPYVVPCRVLCKELSRYR